MTILRGIRFLTLSLVLLLTFMAAQTGTAHAEMSIAVVDVQELLQKSKAAESIQKQLASKRDEYQKDFSKQEKDLRNAEKELLKQRDALSAEAFADKRTEFEKKVLETQKLVQKRKNDMDRAVAKALNTLRGEILKIVADMADEKKIDLVISSQNVVIGKKEIDLTEEVMKKLNADITTITLKIE